MSEQVLRNDAVYSQEQWGGINNIIGTWLVERQDLIRLFCSLSKDKTQQLDFGFALKNFCEILVDYLSAGHFEIFAKLENEARSFDARGINLVKALYPYLEQSTDIALWFNDRCEQLKHSDAHLEEIRSELSYLGEALTDRFELEDQLIEYVHKSNAPLLQ